VGPARPVLENLLGAAWQRLLPVVLGQAERGRRGFVHITGRCTLRVCGEEAKDRIDEAIVGWHGHAASRGMEPSERRASESGWFRVSREVRSRRVRPPSVMEQPPRSVANGAPPRPVAPVRRTLGLFDAMKRAHRRGLRDAGERSFRGGFRS
jgi:hypothetical protein